MCYQLLGKERSNILFPSGPPSSSAQGRNDVLPVCEAGTHWCGMWGSGSPPGLASLKAVESGMDGVLMAVWGQGVGGGRQPKARLSLETLCLNGRSCPWAGIPVSLGSPRFPRRRQTYFFFPDNRHASEKGLEGEVGIEEEGSKESCPRNPDSLCSLQLKNLQVKEFGFVLFVLASKAF